MMVAIVLSLAILFGFNYFFEKPRVAQMEAQMKAQQEQAAKLPDAAMPGTSAAAPVVKDRAAVIAESQRIPVRGAKIRGSLSLKGARLDDLLLDDYFTTAARKENVSLLSPAGTATAFYVESGWLAPDQNRALPDEDTVWSLASGSPAAIEAGGAPVILVWDNGQGLLFEREISLDDNYLFTVTQKLTNKTDKALDFNAYYLAARNSLPPDFAGMFVLHEGPISYLDGKREEPSYKDLRKGDVIEKSGVKGWLGITDKYWMVGLLPDPSSRFNARVMGSGADQKEHYQSDIVSGMLTAEPGQTLTHGIHVYAGVKMLPLMQSYQEKYGFDHLELGIDFGMWYLITKPFFYLLHFLAHGTGNIAIAILLITVIVRAAVFPLASKSFRSMAGMKKIGPQLKELQEKHGKDKEKLQMEIYELYRRENVNPFSGCWPILIQIPIFFALYKVILISVELRHAPFWGWIKDLSAPDPTSVFNLFGMIPWTPPSLLMIGAWPCLFCLTMIVQKRLSPPMADPVQEKIQGMFPYIVSIMMAHFASGLVIYWTWSNALAILQQYYILKKVGGEETSIIRGHVSRRKKKKE